MLICVLLFPLFLRKTFQTIEMIKINNIFVKFYITNLNNIFMRKTLLLISMFVAMFATTAFAQEATTDAPVRYPVFTMGEEGSQNYRIPALVQAPDGSLVAIADQRGSALGDLPNIISIVAKRSTDGGKTWGKMVTIAQGDKTAGTTYGDAVAVVDEEAKKIIAIFVGNENYGSSCVGLWASNSSYPLRLYQSESTDNGVTWTKPVDISESIYNAIYGSRRSWIGMFAGSGCAVQLKKGEHAGRLMFVVAARNDSSWGGTMSNYAVYSDDHGATWQVSTNAACTTGDEAKVVELENGDILMSIKNRRDDSYNGGGSRLMAKSTDGGKTWSTATVNNNLMDPACNGDIVSVTHNGTYYLLHSLPASSSVRENVTVYLSSDNGQTWDVKREIYSGYSAYSSMQVLEDGTVGILVEEGKWDGNLPGADGFNLAYYNFTLDWLIGDDSAVSEETVALITEVKELLESTPYIVGLPAEAPRAALLAAIETAEDNPTEKAGITLLEALEEFYASTDIILPEAGKGYTIAAVYDYELVYYLYNNAGTLGLCKEEDLSDAAIFVCEEIEGEYKYQFKTYNDEYYLAYPTIGGKNWLDNESETGLELDANLNVTKLNVAKILTGGNVAAANADLYGCVRIDGYRGYDNGKNIDMYGPIVVKHSAGVFDGAADPFYNTDFTSAFMMQEVELKTEPEPTAVESVEVETVNVVYDLCGRQVDTITGKGVYVVNGKKVLVK